MRTLIVYTSVHHGNTEKVATAMAGELRADIVRAVDADPAGIDRYDLIGFGSGIYHNRHHQSLLRFAESLEPVGRELRDTIVSMGVDIPFTDRLRPVGGKLAFIFSTSGRGLVKDHAALRDILTVKGLRIIGEFTCKGWDTYTVRNIVGGINRGKPDAEDIERAVEFARNLVNSWNTAAG
jgi:flavodoxin